MDKIPSKKEIVFGVIFLLTLGINVRPYSKNFILPANTPENLIDRISKISRSLITFEINDGWIEDYLINAMKSRPHINYNIIISGETGRIRIKNIKQLNPKKIGYIINEFADSKKISELNMLKPYPLFLIFKRLPENFELPHIRDAKIRELLIYLDAPSATEFIAEYENYSDFRITLKPLDIEAFHILCSFKSDSLNIIADSRIIDSEYISGDEIKICQDKIVYELSSLTYFNNFILFIRSNINQMNIYYSPLTPKRDTLFDWIHRTDP
ncbi:MAG: hypothetical protein N3B13_02020 [Deltaproteobacteria bacterium]|nr:hypothetical protein [Deltaproteobacteria bacterium]